MKSVLPPFLFFLVLLRCISANGQEVSTLQELQSRLREMNDPPSSQSQEYTDLLIAIGLQFRFVDNDSLKYYTDKAQQSIEQFELDNPLTQAFIYRNLGYYYSEQGKSQQALEYYAKVVDISDQHDLPELHLRALIWMSDEYYYLDQKGNELVALLKVIEAGEKDRENHLMELSIATENIAFLYADQEEFEKALDYFRQVLLYNEELSNPVSTAQTFTNLADTLSEMGEFSEAMDYIDQAIAVFETRDTPEWLATAYQIKGLIYYESDQFELSLDYVLKAQGLLENIDDERLSISLMLDHAYTLYRLDQPEEAERKVLEAQQSKIVSNDIQLQQEILELLFEINKARGKADWALSYLEDYRNLSDSIRSVQKANRIDMLFAQLKFEDEKKAIVQANREVALKQRNQLTLTLAIVGLLLATLIPLYFKQKRLNVLNNSLKEREKELVEINQTKDVMFSILGHDLKSPLTSFHAALKLFNDGILENKNVHKAISKLDKNLDHLLLTLDNLLFWGASQLKGAKTYPSVFKVHDAVEKVTALLLPLAEAKNIGIDNRVPPSAECYVDRDQVELVIRNLLTNAIKYTPEGGENIVVNASQTESFWTIYVEDSGIGIAKETQLDLQNQKLLRPSQGTGKEKGSGIGLLLTQRMIKNNGGTFGFSSDSKKGTVFYFTLPIAANSNQKAYETAAQP